MYISVWSQIRKLVPRKRASELNSPRGLDFVRPAIMLSCHTYGCNQRQGFDRHARKNSIPSHAMPLRLQAPWSSTASLLTCCHAATKRKKRSCVVGGRFPNKSPSLARGSFRRSPPEATPGILVVLEQLQLNTKPLPHATILHFQEGMFS